jgi:hypothetical protein
MAVIDFRLVLGLVSVTVVTSALAVVVAAFAVEAARMRIAF